MIALLAAAAFLGQGGEGTWTWVGTGADDPNNRLRYFVPFEKLEEEKLSPLKFKDSDGNLTSLKFPFLVAGYGRYERDEPGSRRRI